VARSAGAVIPVSLMGHLGQVAPLAVLEAGHDPVGEDAEIEEVLEAGRARLVGGLDRLFGVDRESGQHDRAVVITDG